MRNLVRLSCHQLTLLPRHHLYSEARSSEKSSGLDSFYRIFQRGKHVSSNNHICPSLHHPTYFLDWAGCAARIGESSHTIIEPFLIYEQVYALYLRICRSDMDARLRKLKTELLNTKTELLKTSAQDQFAKWAKLRRSVDKGLADLDKLSGYRTLGRPAAFTCHVEYAIYIFLGLTSCIQIARLLQIKPHFLSSSMPFYGP